MIFLGQKPKILKIRDNIFPECFWHLLAFLLAFCFKTLHSRSHWKLAVFLPKIEWHDVTEMPFSQNLFDGFRWNLCECANLLLYRAPQVSPRYLHPILSYSESSLGELNQWRVKHCRARLQQKISVGRLSDIGINYQKV